MTDPTIGGTSIAFMLGIWGALLSTILAAVRLWELWVGRFQVDVSTLFTSSEEMGHRVSVRNLSGKPLILEYWEIVLLSGHWPRRQERTLVSPEADTEDIAIPAHTTLPLLFREEDHFPWGRGLRRDRIAIRLHFAGRRPILRMLSS